MKVGDKVLTRDNEIGTIVSGWEHNDNSYCWWVEIPFLVSEQEFIAKIPFKSSDLKVLDQKLGESNNKS